MINKLKTMNDKIDIDELNPLIDNENNNIKKLCVGDTINIQDKQLTIVYSYNDSNPCARCYFNTPITSINNPCSLVDALIPGCQISGNDVIVTPTTELSKYKYNMLKDKINKREIELKIMKEELIKLEKTL